MQTIALKNTLIRVVPVCFVLGMGMEWFMINVRVGQETFYDTAKRKEMERRLDVARRQRMLEGNQADAPESGNISASS